MKSLFRIRTVTAFLTLHPKDFSDNGDIPSTLETKISATATLLQRLQNDLTGAGYEVQTLRMATNPFGEWILPTIRLTASDDDEEEDNVRISKEDVVVAQSRLEQLSAQLKQHGITLCAVGPATSVSEIKQCCPLIVSDTSGILSCSANVGATQVSMATAAAEAVHIISKLESGLGNFRFCVTAANTKPFIPFFPAAKSASSLLDTTAEGPPNENNSNKNNNGLVGFALGLENGKLAQHLLQKCKSMENISTIFRNGMVQALTPVQDVCQAAANEYDYHYLGLDTSLNPSLEEGGSVATAMEYLEEIDHFGGPGTVGAAAAITTALQSLPGIRLTGYCGLMLPVCEDQRLADLAMQSGKCDNGSGGGGGGGDVGLRIADLLCVSSVCGVGVDTVPLAGDVSTERLTALILDMAGLAARWDKNLSCRVLPFAGKQVGDRTDFDSPYMVNTNVFHL